jgi:hypothetical protein
MYPKINLPMKKTFKAIKKEAAKHLMAPAKSIAVLINKGLVVFVKAGSDVEAIRKKYLTHISDYKNYAQTYNAK